MKKEIVIVGGGVVGLAMAASLAKLPVQIAVIDAKPFKQPNISETDLRVFAINPASQKLLTNCAAWSELDMARVSAYRNMYVWDQCSDGVLDFKAQQLAKADLGHIIEQTNLLQALLKVVRAQDNISLLGEQQLKHVTTTPEQVFLETAEQTIQARLVIGADGANSWLRSELDFNCQATAYQHHALVCNVEVEHSHQQTAYQIFTEEGPLAFLPLVDEHQCSIVWSVPPQQAKALSELSKEDFMQALEQAFQSKLGKMTAVSQRVHFPLVERVVSPYVKPRVALIGDALHTIHPLAGLGMNVGLADVATLSQVIVEDIVNFDAFKTLRKYERNRKGAVMATTKLMSLIKHSFSKQGLPPMLRSLGMNFISSNTLLKRKIIDLASG